MPRRPIWHGAACLAGHGIAQLIDLGIDAHLRSGMLEPVLTDWPDETFPLYVYYPSRSHLPAKVRAFIDFIVGSMLPAPTACAG